MAIPPRDVIETPLDKLRSLLDRIGDETGALERSSSDDVLSLMRMLDESEKLYTQMLAADVDLRAEESRLETYEQIIKRKAGIVLGRLGQRGGITALRPANTPPENWWWYLDAYMAEQHRRQLRGLARTGLIIAIILGIATLLYNTVLKPDPQLLAKMDAVQKIQTAIEQGDNAAAGQAADKAAVDFPHDSEVLLWHGAVLMLLNRPQDAAAAFAAARAVFPDEVSFLVGRSQIYLQAGDSQAALADAQAAVKADPNNPQAFLMVGGAQENLGQLQPAIDAYNQAASLAATQKNSQLEAMAKVRMAMLMQAGPSNPFPTPQPTP